MVKDFRDLDINLINSICNDFETYRDFNILRQIYPYLDHNILYSVLFSIGKYKKELYSKLQQVNIGDKKILLISDTHYGSAHDNMKYAHEVFNFAVANGIHSIFHGGDIIESEVNAKDIFRVKNQAYYFIYNYPHDKSIKTYALLGNHDYSAININAKVRDTLDSRDDIDILGFKKIYFKWSDCLISLAHEIDDYKVQLPVRAEYLSFKGHSHYYHINKKDHGKCERIYIPSLSDNPIPSFSNIPYLKDNSIIVKPGFLTAEMYNDGIEVVNYSIDDNKITVENEFVKTFKKKK